MFRRRRRYPRITERDLEVWTPWLIALAAASEQEQRMLEFQHALDVAQAEILQAFREVQLFVGEMRVALANGDDVAEPLATLGESLGDLIANMEEHLTGVDG